MEIVIGYMIAVTLIVMVKEMFQDSKCMFIGKVAHGVLTYE